MSDLRENLRAAVEELIGAEKKFSSGRELAQRAHTLGLVDNAENFARTVNRVRSDDKDVQLSTIDIIARAAGCSAVDLLVSRDGQPSAVIESKSPKDGVPISDCSASARELIRAIVGADKRGMDSRAFDLLRETLRLIGRRAEDRDDPFDVEAPFP